MIISHSHVDCDCLVLSGIPRQMVVHHCSSVSLSDFRAALNKLAQNRYISPILFSYDLYCKFIVSTYSSHCNLSIDQLHPKPTTVVCCPCDMLHLLCE